MCSSGTPIPVNDWGWLRHHHHRWNTIKMNEYTDIEYRISIIRFYRVHALPLGWVSLGERCIFSYFSAMAKGLNVYANIHRIVSREKRLLQFTCVVQNICRFIWHFYLVLRFWHYTLLYDIHTMGQTLN